MGVTGNPIRVIIRPWLRIETYGDLGIPYDLRTHSHPYSMPLKSMKNPYIDAEKILFHAIFCCCKHLCLMGKPATSHEWRAMASPGSPPPAATSSSHWSSACCMAQRSTWTAFFGPISGHGAGEDAGWRKCSEIAECEASTWVKHG